MVTAKPGLSNIFLHTGQDVEKTGESGIQVVAGRGERLEECVDWHFNFDAQVKRLPFEGLKAAGDAAGQRILTDLQTCAVPLTNALPPVSRM